MAFHPYPQLIQIVFSRYWFGPPFPITGTLTWPWIDHSVSGLLHATMRPIQTRFRFGFTSRLNLAGHRNSQAHYAKGTRSHVACAIVLSRLVDIRFQSLFTPLAGVLFTFPSRYWFTIGHQVVFSLGRWSSRIPTGFLVSRCTQELPTVHFDFDYGAITLFG